jgi:hypothetical protein
MLKKYLLFGVSLLVLAACAVGEAKDPAKTVEKYLQAKVNGDAKTLRPLLCSKMEADLEREVQAFSGPGVTGVRLEGITCERQGTSDTVRCQGKIVALYGAQQTEFPLTAYRVVQEDGEWKWCGEAP